MNLNLRTLGWLAVVATTLFLVWWLKPEWLGYIIPTILVLAFIAGMFPPADPTAPRETSQPRDSAGRGSPPASVDLTPATPDFIAEWKDKGGQAAQHDAEGGK